MTRRDEGTARLGHLLTVDGEKAARARRSAAQPAPYNTAGPEQIVKVADVFADKMMQFRLSLDFQ
jgi:hypothetical protein